MLIPKNEFAELAPVRRKAPLAVDRLKAQALHPAMRLMEGRNAMRLDPSVRSCLDVAAKRADQPHEMLCINPANYRPRNGVMGALFDEAAHGYRKPVDRGNMRIGLVEKRAEICPALEPVPHPLFRRVFAYRLEIARPRKANVDQSSVSEICGWIPNKVQGIGAVPCIMTRGSVLNPLPVGGSISTSPVNKG